MKTSAVSKNVRVAYLVELCVQAPQTASNGSFVVEFSIY